MIAISILISIIVMNLSRMNANLAIPIWIEKCLENGFVCLFISKQLTVCIIHSYLCVFLLQNSNKHLHPFVGKNKHYFRISRKCFWGRF